MRMRKKLWMLTLRYWFLRILLEWNRVLYAFHVRWRPNAQVDLDWRCRVKRLGSDVGGSAGDLVQPIPSRRPYVTPQDPAYNGHATYHFEGRTSLRNG